MKLILLLCLGFVVVMPLFASNSAVKALQSSRQIIIAIAPNWQSKQAKLYFFEKQHQRWQQTLSAFNAKIGSNGLAWGVGIYPTKLFKHSKCEGDKKTPAGLFYLRKVFGYAAKNDYPFAINMPYLKVTKRDLWVEDSRSKYYNRHLRLQLPVTTKWQKQQQMRQGDIAHAVKIFIAHNEASINKKAIPFAGSAIFLHLQRQRENYQTAGCTAVTPAAMKQILQRIDSKKKPLFLIMPQAIYQYYQKKWYLPVIK